MNHQQRKRRLTALGYTIRSNQKDCFGKKWRYCTSPYNMGGSTNYFNSLDEVDRYIIKCEKNRSWQLEVMTPEFIDVQNKLTCG